jgi:hypothetical protein
MEYKMGVVEHERSLRGTQDIAEYFSDFSSALQLPEYLSQYRHKPPYFIIYFI